ncbi:hypothetical protein AVEN_68577-1 [Araneus ventricosus]|uniref:Uncharacterized protein n=1 Tax=Araneus ventricosus TaxID=182803 RepID=A0A4Y2FGS3_ARAVE|nr:hypothetical protein AVEN_68577-1 [Araneus ventricosus]
MFLAKNEPILARPIQRYHSCSGRSNSDGTDTVNWFIVSTGESGTRLLHPISHPRTRDPPLGDTLLTVSIYSKVEAVFTLSIPFQMMEYTLYTLFY